jgi:hypothetical protein
VEKPTGNGRSLLRSRTRWLENFLSEFLRQHSFHRPVDPDIPCRTRISSVAISIELQNSPAVSQPHVNPSHRPSNIHSTLPTLPIHKLPYSLPSPKYHTTKVRLLELHCTVSTLNACTTSIATPWLGLMVNSRQRRWTQCSARNKIEVAALAKRSRVTLVMYVKVEGWMAISADRCEVGVCGAQRGVEKRML